MSWEQFFKDNRGILKSYEELRIKIREFVESGADINFKNKYGETLLHLASGEGHLEIVKILIENKADVNSKDYIGDTPLHCASEEGHLEIVKILIESGADLNSKNKYNNTPLHYASWDRYLKMMGLYIRNIVDIINNNCNDITSLDIDNTFGKKRLKIVKILVNSGAQLNQLNINGLKPIDVAEDDEIKEFLATAKQMLDNRKIYPYLMVLYYGHVNRTNKYK